MAKNKKKPSRADRWNDAVSAAREVVSQLETALENLREVQEEYESWKDNLPESLQSATVGEKLEAVCDLDVEGAKSALEEVTNLLDEAESADLPLGWGRD